MKLEVLQTGLERIALLAVLGRGQNGPNENWVAVVRAAGISRHSPSNIRSEVTACVGEMRAEGLAWDQCKDAIGICKATLYAWHREATGPSASTAMVPVKIRDVKTSELATTSGGLRLITPGGHQLVGLDLNQAVQLLRALG